MRVIVFRPFYAHYGIRAMHDSSQFRPMSLPIQFRKGVCVMSRTSKYFWPASRITETCLRFPLPGSEESGSEARFELRIGEGGRQPAHSNFGRLGPSAGFTGSGRRSRKSRDDWGFRCGWRRGRGRFGRLTCGDASSSCLANGSADRVEIRNWHSRQPYSGSPARDGVRGRSSCTRSRFQSTAGSGWLALTWTPRCYLVRRQIQCESHWPGRTC